MKQQSLFDIDKIQHISASNRLATKSEKQYLIATRDNLINTKDELNEFHFCNDACLCHVIKIKIDMIIPLIDNLLSI